MTILDNFARSLIAVDAAIDARVDAMIPAALLDIVGACVAGRAASESRALDDDTLAPLGSGLLDQVARAVAATRSTETDDIHLASCTTPGSIIVPTALLLAPAFGAPSDRVRRAIAAGYDAMIRFGEAVRGPEILYRGLWPTFLAAPFGAAATAALVAGLDAEQTADALAIALTQISGAAGQGGAGHNPRWLFGGLAARGGCVAALASRKGFGGDRQLLDGDWLQRTHGIAFDAAPLAEAQPGAALAEISRKPFCAAKQTIAAIDAFMRVLAEGVVPQSIASVKVIVPTIYRAMIARAPIGRQDRVASVAYQLALAAYRPDDLFDIERPQYDDPRLADFIARVEVVADPALDHFYPQRWPARVEVELADGARRMIQVESAYGDPLRPLTDKDLDSKFLRLATPAVGEGAAREILKSCRGASEEPDAFDRIAARLNA